MESDHRMITMTLRIGAAFTRSKKAADPALRTEKVGKKLDEVLKAAQPAGWAESLGVEECWAELERRAEEAVEAVREEEENTPKAQKPWISPRTLDLVQRRSHLLAAGADMNGKK